VSSSSGPSALSLSTTGLRIGLVGHPVSLGVALSGGSDPTGTITFALYSPHNGPPRKPVFSSQASVNGDGSYSSGGYVPKTTGDYEWVVTYSGDSNNPSLTATATQVVDKVATLEGLVRTDKRKTVKGATVSLDGSPVAVTSKNGKYTLREVPGTYTVTVQFESSPCHATTADGPTSVTTDLKSGRTVSTDWWTS